MQDIRPTQSKSLTKDAAPRFVPRPKNPAAMLPKEVPFVPSEPKGSSRHGLWIVAVICIIGLVASLSFLFESAVVNIVPKSIPIALDATDMFTAVKDSTDTNTLSYMIMSIPGDVSVVLPATETKNVSDFAKGTVTLFNNYSKVPFRIVKNTPILSANGVLYKVDNLVMIPGYTKSATGTIPGTIDVTVTCATSGEIGNVDTSDFTIPYFAKRPEAGFVYAKTKTSIAGGISGILHTVPRSASDAAYQSLKDKLRAKLISQTKVQVPPGYLFFDGAVVFDTDDTVLTPYSKDTQIPLGLHGKLTTYLIKEDTLVKNIVTKFVSGYAGEPVTIPKLSSLVFVPPTSPAFSPADDTSITFNFEGSLQILWTIKTDDIKNTLASSPKNDFEKILSGISGVEKADMVIKPFWKQSFPEDPKRITVNVLSSVQ